MKRVIKHQKKMKNTMYIVFGVFALALFAITRANPSYASDGLILDDALDMIAGGSISEETIPEEQSELDEELVKGEDNEESQDLDDKELEGEDGELGEKGDKGDEGEENQGEGKQGENLDDTEYNTENNTEGDKESNGEENREEEDKDNGSNDKIQNEGNDVNEDRHGVTDENGGETVDGELDNNKQEENKEEKENDMGEKYGFKVKENEKIENNEEIIESEEIYGTGEYDGVKVDVYAPEGAFPIGTILSIVPVTGDNEMNDIQDVLEEQKNVDKTEKLIAFDITFRDPDTDEELQPLTGTVQVSFNYADNEELKAAEEDEEQEVKIYHLNNKDEEGEKIEEIKDVVVEEVVVNEEESEEENVMVIEAGSFSVYTIVVQVKEEQLANFEYGMISIANPSNSNQGITIMDRNLGATTKGWGKTAPESSYGFHYQWGNNYGFAPNLSSYEIVTGNTQVDVSNITEYSSGVWVSNTDWMTPFKNIWGEGGQGPCPKGWHVPGYQEWNQLLQYYAGYYSNLNNVTINLSNNMGGYGISNNTDFVNGFLSYFKIPLASFRKSNASLDNWHSSLWSSSSKIYVGNDNAWNFWMKPDNLGVTWEYYSYGYQIRCFKNSYVGSTSNFFNINFDYRGGLGSTASINVVNGGTGTKPSDPVRENSIFSGRYLSGADVEFDFTGTNITQDITLYAKWNCGEGYQEFKDKCVTNHLYTITFDTDGGTEKDDLQVLGGVPMIESKVSHTPNIDDAGNQSGGFATGLNTNEVVKIPGAERLKIKIVYGSYGNYYDRVSMWEGSHPDYTAYDNYSTSKIGKLGGGNHLDNEVKKYEVEGDTVTFGFRSYQYNYGGDRYGYYAIIEDVQPNYDFGENPTLEGKVFDGWYNGSGEKWNEYTDIVDSDITLYAHWKDPEAILLPGKEFNKKIKNLANNATWYSESSSDNMINSIVRTGSIPSGVEVIEIQSEDSNFPIYAWFKKGTIYIYSESDTIYMNPNSNYMFYNMYSLKNLDTEAFDTNKVESMEYMFGYCYAIDNLNLSSWNVEKVRTMSNMFYYAYGIKDLNLSDWKTDNLQNTSNMFYYAQALKNLNLSGWNTSKVINVSQMFYYCTALESLILDGWDLSNNPTVSSMFYYLYSLKTLSLKNWKIPQTMRDGLYQTFGLYNSNALETIDVSNWDLSKTTSLYKLFYDLYSLTEIIGLETRDTSNIENMNYTFAYLYNVENLDGVSNWNVSNVTNMNSMFYNCRSLEELDLSRWNTSKVTNMDYMFQGCGSLKKLNLDNWDFRSLGYNMYMFGDGTRDLEEIGSKNRKFANNIDSLASHMGFCYCSKNSCKNDIKEIDVSGWTFEGTSLNGLFCGWESLRNIKGLETRDVSNIKGMEYMFAYASNLDKLNLSAWNTKNLTGMFEMFYLASGLAEVDLSSFDTSKVIDMNKMFQGTSNLKTVYVSDKFTTTSLLSGDNMFSGATSIVGGNGTVFNPSKINQEYAKIDTLTQSGYFTNVLDKPYIITYNLDNGILSGEKTVYTQRDTFTLKNPIKTGYTFLGWTGSNGNIPQVEVNIQSGTIKGDLEYSANWKINQYTITFDTDGGNEVDSISIDYNLSFSGISLPTPTKGCNAFSGWENVPEKMPAHDITLKATWNYTCSKSSGGGGGSSTIKIEDEKDNHGVADETENDNEKDVDETGTEKQDNQDFLEKDNVDTPAEGEKDNSKTEGEYTQEQVDAYTFAKSKGITTIPTIEKAKMNTSLKRIEMAKMLSYYAINVLGQTPNAEKGIVKFNDVTSKLDKQYDNGVTLAYGLGIMGINMKNNNFRPYDEVTRAEFATALSRLLYKTDEGNYKGTGKYYEPHMAKLYNEGIITNTNPKLKEMRGYVMLMLMRSVK